MQAPDHPMDNRLRARGWQRARPEDLKGESHKLAARLILRPINLDGHRGPSAIAVIDVHLWQADNGSVRFDMALPFQSSMLHPLIAQGLRGVSAHGLGLTPCRHEPWHWNPFCLPLIWQPEMDNMDVFRAFSRRYYRYLTEETSWQCPDAALVMRVM